MGTKRFKKTTRKMVFKRYDSIVKSMKVVERYYGVKRVPIKTMKIIIDKAMFGKVENKNLELFTKDFNKTLDIILMFSKDNSKIVGDNCISRMEVQQWIDALKASFIKGQNEKAKPNDQEYD